MIAYRHSVKLNESKCNGCSTCLKRCPAEAIRIRDGHAFIMAERCIDCGECIRVCPNKAKKAVFDPIDEIPFHQKYTIALPPPSLYGQFDHLDEIDSVLQGLLDLGFDDVFEVSAAAELHSEYTRQYMKRENIPKPVISSACPVVTRLISLRYPYLCDHVMPMLPPMEMAARLARRRALERNPHLRHDDVFVVFISPCTAKVSYIKNGDAEHRSAVDLVVSMGDIYFRLIDVMKRDVSAVDLSRTGKIGLSWASVGGEATAVFNDRYLAADGIENVHKVLEEIDNAVFPDIDFVELNACPGGCVGGTMTVANPFVAKARLRTLRHYLPVTRNSAADGEGRVTIPDHFLTETLTYQPVSTLSDDRAEAMRLMGEIQSLQAELPGIDCGGCGAPSCYAFAADVIAGCARPDECVELLRRSARQPEKTEEQK